MPRPDSPALSRSILSWYSKNARDLPWRRTKDPYAIWVSEIMLQQTQVRTVIDYYERWMKRFPSVEALAAAGLADVLSQWAGLGYYRRARMLHEGAKLVAASGGKIPQSVEELVKLPGIGRYTAGAISSIAFGRKAPVLDGNVMRILARIYALKEDIGGKAALDKLWSLAAELLPDENPGDLNQGLMELGATVCFPLNPACGECPAAQHCEAKRLGRQTDFPVKKSRESLEKIETFALVLRRGDEALLQRQPEYGRWGGLWMFPHWQSKEAMLASSGAEEIALAPLPVVEHGFTKYRVTLRPYECEAAAADTIAAAEDGESRWVRLEDIAGYALPAPHKKILKELLHRHASRTHA